MVLFIETLFVNSNDIKWESTDRYQTWKLIDCPHFTLLSKISTNKNLQSNHSPSICLPAAEATACANEVLANGFVEYDPICIADGFCGDENCAANESAVCPVSTENCRIEN